MWHVICPPLCRRTDGRRYYANSW